MKIIRKNIKRLYDSLFHRDVMYLKCEQITLKLTLNLTFQQKLNKIIFLFLVVTTEAHCGQFSREINFSFAFKRNIAIPGSFALNRNVFCV